MKPLEQQTLKDAHRALEDLTALMTDWGIEPSEEQYAHAANLAAHLTSWLTASDHHRRFADAEGLPRTPDVVEDMARQQDYLKVTIDDLQCEVGRKVTEIAKRTKQLEDCRRYADKLADSLRWTAGVLGRVLNGDPARNVDEAMMEAERLVADHELMRIERGQSRF